MSTVEDNAIPDCISVPDEAVHQAIETGDLDYNKSRAVYLAISQA
jgi:hypothetical protein